MQTNTEVAVLFLAFGVFGVLVVVDFGSHSKRSWRQKEAHINQRIRSRNRFTRQSFATELASPVSWISRIRQVFLTADRFRLIRDICWRATALVLRQCCFLIEFSGWQLGFRLFCRASSVPHRLVPRPATRPVWRHLYPERCLLNYWGPADTKHLTAADSVLSCVVVCLYLVWLTCHALCKRRGRYKSQVTEPLIKINFSLNFKLNSCGNRLRN